MKTKLYEYLRESTDPLWKGYVDQLGILNTYHQNHLKFMMNQGSAFIHFVVDLQLKPF